jgi:16S rRNA processing protein RimM
VENYGAGDVLEIERPDGSRFMVPMREEAVPEWSDLTGLLIDAAWGE